MSFIGVGTCVIDGNQAGDANYNPAPQAQQSFPVGKGAQTITFTSTAPVGAAVGGPTYTVTATASSGLPVTLTIDPSASAVCSISGSMVSFIGVGTCVIDANQAGDANYNPAPQAQQSFPVVKGSQTITFTSTAPAGAAVGGATYTVTATATSGLPVTFTIDPSASAVCSISGSTVSFIGVGTCVINANQAGNANYNAAPQAQQSFAVVKGSQTITFTSTAPVGATVGGATYTVTATASSGLPVTLTIDPSASAVCSISGSTVSFIGAGTCVIDANQAGNANYNAAPQAQQSFAVGKGSQTISFTSTAPVGATVGSGSYTVTATATSGLPVSFTIDPSASTVCSISGSTVSFIGAGTCVINANQAGNANYNAAPQAQQSFPVGKGSQTISFTSTVPANATVGGSYTVTATATSGLPVSFTIDPSASTVCSVSGSMVSFIGTGTCVINANQAGNANYNAAPQVQQSFQVNQAPQITSANNTTFTSTLPGTFTVTTTGFPTGASMSITVTAGTLPSGVTFTNNNNGTATLSGTPAPGTQVTSPYILTITADNGVPPPAMQTFTLNVINRVPQLVASPKESFDTVGNTQLQVAAAKSVTTPVVFVTGNLKDNFTDADGPNPVTAVPIVAGTTANGGKVDLQSNGEFIFTPKAGDTAATDTFMYQVTDGMATTTARPVTIRLRERAWYVKNNAPAGGQGRSNDPFDTLAEAQAASLANDYIFVYLGTGTNTGQNAGIILKSGQHLLGEHVGLSVVIPSGTFNGASAPTNVNLVAAVVGNLPFIDGPSSPAAGTGHGVEAVDSIPAEVRGISIGAEPVTNGGRNAIEWRTTAAFAGSGAFTIADNVVRGGLNGVHISLVGSGATSLSLHDNTAVSNGTGIDVQETGTGALTITGFANNVVLGNNLGTGISVNSARFDATAGGAYEFVSGGTTVVGVPGDGVGGSGVLLTNVSGDLGFTDLDIFAGGGAGLRVTGTGAVNIVAGTGTQVAVGAVSMFEATGGPAVDVTNATISLPLSSLKSTNSATTGVSLDTVGGTFSAGSIGSSISNATGTSFNVNAGTATISYDGPITNSVGRSVSVTSKTSGSTTFNGTITATGGTGIFLNGNTGSTISFTKQISLTTGANAAFTATGGGTVTATDTTSTLTTTTGVALNVANTTIGAGGLTFASISAGTAASGPANGIVVNNTGSSGKLTVNGGTIQKTTSDGVSLNSTFTPTFKSLTIKNTGGSGVNGTGVTNFSFTNGTIDTTGTASGDSNLAFNDSTVGTENNLSGTVTITGNSLSNAFYHGIDILNYNGTVVDANISSNTLTSSTAAASSQGSAIRLIAFGSATTGANITKATLANNVISNFPTGDGIQVQGGNASAGGPGTTLGTPGSGTNVIAITGNRVAGQSAANKLGGNGILVSLRGSGQGNFDISSNGTVANPITNVAGIGIATSVFGPMTVNVNVANNVVVANNTFGSQGILAGIDNHFGLTDAGTLTATITGNTVSGTDGNGIYALARNSSATLRTKIQNNTVAAPLGGVRPGIRVDSGSASGNTTVCLNISGNTSAGSGGSQGLGLRKQGMVSATNTFGVNGMAATSTPGVEAYVNGLNPAGSGTLLISGTSGFTNCSLP